MNNFALQAVVIPKGKLNLDEAKKKAQDIIKDKKKKFVRITDQSFRFRNIPKQKFIKGSFKTKKLNDGTLLILGELKPEFVHLMGSGIFDFAKNSLDKFSNVFRRDLSNYTNESRKTIDDYGNRVIGSLIIQRHEIPKFVGTVLNTLSFGKFNTLKHDAGYDKLYHLYLLADVGDKKIIIEKNERINVNPNYREQPDTERMPVDLKGMKITLAELLDKTRKIFPDDVEYFGYDALQNNCQIFIRNILLANGLLTPQYDRFIYQDQIGKMGNELPSYVTKIAKFATDTGGVINKLLGRGKKENILRLLASEFVIEGCRPKSSRKSYTINDQKITTKEINDEIDMILKSLS